MLDVAIGLTFIYALLSIVCSAAKESLEAWLKTRAKNLEKGLREMLQDPNATGACKKLWNHPLISALFPGEYGDKPATHRNFWFGTSNLPSYLPTKVFSRAMMDILFGATNPATEGDVDDAQKKLAAVEARFALAPGTPTSEAVSMASAAVTGAQKDLANIEAQVVQAADESARGVVSKAHETLAEVQAILATIKTDQATGPPTLEAVSNAGKAVTEAQAKLVTFKAQVDPSIVQSARAAVTQALGAVTEAQTQLASIKAPVDQGTVQPVPDEVSQARQAVTVVQAKTSLKSLIDNATLNVPAQVVTARTAAIGGETTHPVGSPEHGDKQLKTGLKALADQAQGDMVRFQQELEAWFDARMERLTGLYKRWTNLTILGLAVFVASSMNVDTIAILKQLSTDEELRKGVVEMAMAENKDRNDALAQPRKTVELAETTLAKAQSELIAAPDDTAKKTAVANAQVLKTNAQAELTKAEGKRDTDGKKAREQLATLENGAEKSRLAIGWEQVDWKTPKGCDWWATKFFGIILTAIAISFGAPFWFDLLSRFVSIRSALQPAAQTQTQTTMTTSPQGSGTQTTTTDRNPGKPNPVR